MIYHGVLCGSASVRHLPRNHTHRIRALPTHSDTALTATSDCGLRIALREPPLDTLPVESLWVERGAVSTVEPQGPEPRRAGVEGRIERRKAKAHGGYAGTGVAVFCGGCCGCHAERSRGISPWIHCRSSLLMGNNKARRDPRSTSLRASLRSPRRDSVGMTTPFAAAACAPPLFAATPAGAKKGIICLAPVIGYVTRFAADGYSTPGFWNRFGWLSWATIKTVTHCKTRTCDFRNRSKA